MSARHRWIACMVLYHLVLGIVFLMWGRAVPTTHWSGSLFVFGMLTVQFTWGVTLGLILGPSRKLRKWYWASLLFLPVPIGFTRILTWLAFHFVGLSIAAIVLVACVTVIIIETVAGVMVGVDLSSKFRTS